jgi:hypothetical protein
MLHISVLHINKFAWKRNMLQLTPHFMPSCQFRNSGSCLRLLSSMNPEVFGVLSREFTERCLTASRSPVFPRGENLFFG